MNLPIAARHAGAHAALLANRLDVFLEACVLLHDLAQRERRLGRDVETDDLQRRTCGVLVSVLVQLQALLLHRDRAVEIRH